MPSLYAQYLTERTNKEILEAPTGYAVYYDLGDYCYIEDIFVIPEARKLGVASEIANQIVSKAKLRGKHKLLGSVKPSAKGSTAPHRTARTNAACLQHTVRV
jgi:GNAT superfamily N-acetyltransferase